MFIVNFLTKITTSLFFLRIFMNNKYITTLFCTTLLFGLSYMIATTQSKDKKMITNEQTLTSQHHLDLSKFKKDTNGILYQIIEHGSGKKPFPGQTATVHYTGYLLENNDTVGKKLYDQEIKYKVGKKFDSSVDRNQPFQFRVGVGHVIKGWDISVADMNVGEKRIVILPPNHAYGSQQVGHIIKSNSTLIFEIELLAIS